MISLRSSNVDDLKLFVATAKTNGCSGAKLHDAKTELSRQTAKSDLANALQGSCYRLIHKRLKCAQHWLSKSEVENAHNVIKLLQTGRELDAAKNSKNTRAMGKTCDKTKSSSQQHFASRVPWEHKPLFLETIRPLCFRHFCEVLRTHSK